MEAVQHIHVEIMIDRFDLIDQPRITFIVTKNFYQFDDLIDARWHSANLNKVGFLFNFCIQIIEIEGNI